MRLAERAPEPLGRARNQDQVDVIGHQAIAPHRDALAPARLAEEIAVERVVVVGEEHPLAPGAALGDLMGQVGDDETADARHGGLRDERTGRRVRLVWGNMQVSP